MTFLGDLEQLEIFMETENPKIPNFTLNPAFTPFHAPQSTTGFLSSGHAVGSEASAFRPPPHASVQFPSPPISSGPSFRPPQPSGSNDLVRPLPSSSSYGPPTAHFQNPPFSSIGQAVSPLTGPLSVPPPTRPAAGAFEPAFAGYANTQPNSVAQPPSMHPSSFPLKQVDYAPEEPPTHFLAQHRSYIPGPPITTPWGLCSGSQIQHGIAPPTATSQGFAEDFSSLSLGSAPGSFDAGLDAAALPRPLDGDVEPKSSPETYPVNCNSRFVRLTTSGIPNSQSLASRWHLPLGAIVCPLAEAPPGVSLFCTYNDVFTGHVDLSFLLVVIVS